MHNPEQSFPGESERCFSSADFVSDAQIKERIARRFGITEDHVAAVASGELLLELESAGSTERGLFEHSAAQLLDAQPADYEQAYRYFRNECATAIFETVGLRGHHEKLQYAIDPESGDACITPQTRFGDVYAMDLTAKTVTWRAQLSFTELANNEILAELTQRGLQHDFVVIEASPYPDEADVRQAAQLGYDPETKKGFVRAYYSDQQHTQRTIETLSYSDLRPELLNDWRQSLGMAGLPELSTQAALAGLVIVPRRQFEQTGGLGGVARQLDELQFMRHGRMVVYGKEVDSFLSAASYRRVAEVSAQRRQLAEQIVSDYMADILALAVAAREGRITADERRQQTNDLLVAYRLQLFMNDPQWAAEQYDQSVAHQFDYLQQLQSTGRIVEASQLAAYLDEQLGTIYICGAAVKVNAQGQVVSEKGEVQHCPEIQNGQLVTCPGCKHMVKVIVEKRESLFCPRSECKLSKAGAKGVVVAKKEAPPPQKETPAEPLPEPVKPVAQTVGRVAVMA